MTSHVAQSADRPLLRGIDVSAWQRVIDWPAVAESGIEFAIVRMSVGLQGDAYGEQNLRAARILGELRVTAYHYLESGHGAEEQAEVFLRHYRPDAATVPGMFAPVLDLEEGGADSADRALAWLRIVEEQRGVRPMVYTSAGFADRVGLAKCPELAEYPLWVAHWTDKPEPIVPRPWATDDEAQTRAAWSVWQHANNGRVRGISGPVDLNVARRLPWVDS